MTFKRFLDSPWKVSHVAYDTLPIAIRPAPEFATGEVVLASTFRSVGFSDLRESEVPRYGRLLDRSMTTASSTSLRGTSIDLATWRRVVHGMIESPKQPNQSARRFIQLCPLVPDACLYSQSARLRGNSWVPGELVRRMILLGAGQEVAAEQVWRQLFEALSVDESDDIWARWLQWEFARRRIREVQGHKWRYAQVGDHTNTAAAFSSATTSTASQFVRDLRSILAAKSLVTRRQWISMLEALLRLATVTHVLSLSELQYRFWTSIRTGLQTGRCQKNAVAAAEPTGQAAPGGLLAYGSTALPAIRRAIARYLTARIGINAVLWRLGEHGLAISTLASNADVVHLQHVIVSDAGQRALSGVLTDVSSVCDAQARVLSCKKGIGSNMEEFARHVLGQRQVGDETLRGYDQGYFLRKAAQYPSAPWVVSLGPVALMALVHCCLKETSGPRSISRLAQHLATYGISVDRDAISSGDIGQKLRVLGLVLDSPDAESGMLLLPPFSA